MLRAARQSCAILGNPGRSWAILRKHKVTHLRALLSAREAVAQGALGGACSGLGDELVVDGGVHEDAGGGAADLALVEEDAVVGRLHRLVHVSILADDEW